MQSGDASTFFAQLGIKHVVWVDDLFDSSGVIGEVEIIEKVAIAQASGTLTAHPEIGDLTIEDPPQDWARILLQRLGQSEIHAYLATIAPGDEASHDYSELEITTVLSSLGQDIIKIGFERWGKEKEDLTGKDPNGVFIVDRERRSDGQPVNAGDEIVRELLNVVPGAVVLILTHSVGSDGAEQLRDGLAEALGVPKAKIGVVSKRADGGLAKGIRAAFRVVFTQFTCAHVTDKIVNAMRESLVNTQNALMRIPLQQLDRAVFENSLDEGASEIDVLIRILSSRQRAEVAARIAGDIADVDSPLARLRKLRGMEPLPDQSQEESDLLTRWSHDEVFESGERVNATRSPLACGDVFRKGETNQYYVLLGPPCDLAVRGNGSRSGSEAFFVKLKQGAATAGSSEGKFFEVPALSGNGRWVIDFRSWYSVQLQLLDWAAFNEDGSLTFVPASAPPPGLLPGWEKRFRDTKNRFKVGRTYCISVGELPGKAAVATTNGVAFAYKRIARLHAPRASAAFSAFANFHARGAFDHDFAKGLVADPPPEVETGATGDA
jgi:hypothetical protein